MDTATLVYLKAGNYYSRNIAFMRLIGLLEPDRLVRIAKVHECRDGSIKEQILGFHKAIQLDVAPTTTPAERRFLVGFLLGEFRSIEYHGLISEVIFKDAELVSQWVYECEHNRAFTILALDPFVYRRWQDGVASDTDMFYTAIVEITGTATSPQTFTTNVAPIATDIWGNPFPNFTSMKASIVGIPANNSQFVFCLVGEATLIGGNLTWSCFMSEFDIPASDGKFYVKFTISAQTTT